MDLVTFLNYLPMINILMLIIGFLFFLFLERKSKEKSKKSDAREDELYSEIEQLKLALTNSATQLATYKLAISRSQFIERSNKVVNSSNHVVARNTDGELAYVYQISEIDWVSQSDESGINGRHIRLPQKEINHNTKNLNSDSLAFETDQGFYMVDHIHPWSEGVICDSGIVEMKIGPKGNKKTHRLLPGQCVYIPPNVEHDFTSITDARVFVVWYPKMQNFNIAE